MKDDNVKPFPVKVEKKVSTEFKPDPNLINVIEQILELAKAGEIDHFVGVGYSSKHHESSDGWYYDENNPQPFAVLGALESLKLDLMNLTIERRSNS